MSQNSTPPKTTTFAIRQDIEVFPDADIVVPHGTLKQGAVVRVSDARFRGKAPYKLVSGEGPAHGWVGVHVLVLHDDS